MMIHRDAYRPGFWARLPLGWRVVLVAFALIVVLMGGLGMLITLTEEHALLSNQATALYTEANAALSPDHPTSFGGQLQLVPPGQPCPPVGTLDSSALPQLSQLARRLAGASTRVTIYAPNGTLLATTSDLPQVPPSVNLRPRTLSASITNVHSADSYIVRTDARGTRELVILLPLEANGATVGVLALNTPSAPIDASVAATRLILLLGIFGALALAAVLLPLLVGGALRPLRDMEEVTSRIAEGDLSLRLAVPPTDDEVGQLALSFNAMVARLEAAFTRQKRFVSDVSHELRTPLTALGGGLEMLMMGADQGNPEASGRLMRGMYAETERMRRLVQDLLMLTRLDEGQVELRSQPVVVADVIGEVADQALQIANGQEVTTEVAAGTPPALTDPDRLRQVLLNISENAIKFTPPSGHITLRAYPSATGKVVIEVADTGVGIPAEALPHVFERFYRADPSRSRAANQVGGSGLGLAIAKELVQASGGQISVASQPGHGTTFALEFAAAVQRIEAPQRALPEHVSLTP